MKKNLPNKLFHKCNGHSKYCFTRRNLVFFHYPNSLFFGGSQNHNFLFFMARHNKIMCCELSYKCFFKIFKLFFMSFTMMCMFVHCIYTRYISAHIHQGLNLSLHPKAHQGFNQQTISLTNNKKFKFIMFGMEWFRKFKF